MGELLGIVIPLAAGAAISPAVLTLQLITLSRKTAPLARGWAIAAGYVAVLGAERSRTRASRSPKARASAAICCWAPR